MTREEDEEDVDLDLVTVPLKLKLKMTLCNRLWFKLTPENCPRPLYGRLPSDLPPP